MSHDVLSSIFKVFGFWFLVNVLKFGEFEDGTKMDKNINEENYMLKLK